MIIKRTKGKNNCDKRTVHFFNYYKNSISAVDSIKGDGLTKGSYDLNRRKYGEVIKDLNNGIMELMMLQAFELKLPYRLGLVKIVKFKPNIKINEDGTIKKKGRRVNWKETLLLWERDEESRLTKKIVYHLNDHTNGYSHSFKWVKMKCNIPNNFYYSFVVNRTHKRKLTEYLKNKNLQIDFYESKFKKKLNGRK